MKAYFAIKFHEDCSTREKIEAISNALQSAGIGTVIFARDFEKWGEIQFAPEEMMSKAFSAIDNCDILIIDLSERGVGLGIVAGYAHAKGKPIHVIAEEGSVISETLGGLASTVTFYRDPSDIGVTFRNTKALSADL